ncbi:MAG: AbrB/MazE/SpoVT family DNA-binding domain-containing protein [Candidatus Hydrogenedentes bacterium]|nr:AbrB/MazE/SpoVT family DNA-binding domain-containing protein [Candidatus Hydrogenedentota bacterium]
MHTAKVFPNGRSQAVRLPKEFQFAADEVYVNRIGNVVVLFPREKGWETLVRSLELFSSDFMRDRGQARRAEARESL